jgi:hypothetical protein
MKFKIFRLILLCLTIIFIVYIYTENTGDNSCYNTSVEVTDADSKFKKEESYYECFIDRHKNIY